MSRTRLLPLAAVAAIAIASFGGAHAANLLVNGSFEVDNFNSGGGFRLGLNGNDVTGWFIPASTSGALLLPLLTSRPTLRRAPAVKPPAQHSR